MTFFTLEEILSSILSAALFGAVFAVILVVLAVVFKELQLILSLPWQVFSYQGSIKSKPTVRVLLPKSGKFSSFLDGAAVFVKILLFTVGFILLSYHSLDGSVRIYMLIISLAAYFSVKMLLEMSIFILFDRLFTWLWHRLIIILRIVTLPISRLIFFIWKYLHSKIFKKYSNVQPDSLDKRTN